MAQANRAPRRRRIASVIVLALALFIVFEIGVRLVPPDAVQYRIQTINPDGPGSTRTGTMTDPREVARWDAALRRQPVKSLSAAYTSAWFGTGCSHGTIENASARFTWHGLPIAALSHGSDCTDDLMVSSGGIPDPMTYQVDVDSLLQP